MSYMEIHRVLLLRTKRSQNKKTRSLAPLHVRSRVPYRNCRAHSRQRSCGTMQGRQLHSPFVFFRPLYCTVLLCCREFVRSTATGTVQYTVPFVRYRRALVGLNITRRTFTACRRSGQKHDWGDDCFLWTPYKTLQTPGNWLRFVRRTVLCYTVYSTKSSFSYECPRHVVVGLVCDVSTSLLPHSVGERTMHLNISCAQTQILTATCCYHQYGTVLLGLKNKQKLVLHSVS
jgi:hypothetical protein